MMVSSKTIARFWTLPEIGFDFLQSSLFRFYARAALENCNRSLVRAFLDTTYEIASDVSSVDSSAGSAFSFC